MENLYNVNGLIFWNERQIQLRNHFVEAFVTRLKCSLKKQNPAFDTIQVEAPLLTPADRLNPQYTEDDIFTAWPERQLTLRPETTMGSYAYFLHLIQTGGCRPPIVVWQHGKSFRKEQDQVTKNMRLKEFYQLEFQIIFSPKTVADYGPDLVRDVWQIVSDLVGPCRLEDSDRIPHYASWTKDVVMLHNNMEVCSMSARKDLDNWKVLEVAVGTDRLVYNYEGLRELNKPIEPTA